MELDPLLIIVVGGSVGALLIERVFYYKSKYRKNRKPENPNYGERIATLEEAVDNIKEDIMEIKRKLNRK